MATVSVHIVTFNSESDIGECLESVFQQRYPVDEIIIVDNASQDQTLSVVNRYSGRSNLRVIRNGENLGFAAAHNQALAVSRSDYILVLNPDVVLHPDYVWHLVKRMEENPQLGSVTGKLLYYNSDIIDSTGLVINKFRCVFDRGAGERDLNQFDQNREVFGVSGAAAFYRRKMIEEISYEGEFFDESFFAYKEDVDVAWRARLFGWKAEFVPKAIAYHKRGWGTNRSRSSVPLKIRKHSYMNRYFMMVKNESLFYFFLHLPYILLYECASFVYILLKEQELLSCWKTIFRLLPVMLEKRKWIMRNRKTKTAAVYKNFPHQEYRNGGSIDHHRNL